MPMLNVLGVSARALAGSARRAGFQPHAIDLFADRDLAAIATAVKIDCYPRGFAAALEAAPQAPWLYAGGLENFPGLVDQLATIRPLWGNAGPALRRVRDLRVLCSAAEDAGCRFPCTRLGRTTIGQDAAPDNPARWLVKPRRSGGGVNIRQASAADTARSPRDTIIQQLISGNAASAVYVAASGKAHLLGMTRQLAGSDFSLDRPFLYAGSLGPLDVTNAERARLITLGELLAVRCGLVGLFNVDFIRSESNLWPLEVNPRYSASVEVLERALAFSAVALQAAACTAAAVAPPISANPGVFAGEAIVYAPHSADFPAAIDNLARSMNASPLWPQLADLPAVGERVEPGQPVLTVLAEADSLAAVESQLRARVAAILQLLTPVS